MAARAGFSKGAFYSNFESKDEVFLALLDVHIEADLRSPREALQRDASPEAFVEFLRARGGRHTKEAEAWRLLSAEFWLHVVRHPELAPKLAARQRAARDAVAAMIETRCAESRLAPPVPADQLASLILAVDDGLRLQEFLDPEAVPDDLRAMALMLLFAAVPPADADCAGGVEGGATRRGVPQATQRARVGPSRGKKGGRSDAAAGRR